MIEFITRYVGKKRLFRLLEECRTEDMQTDEDIFDLDGKCYSTARYIRLRSEWLLRHVNTQTLKGMERSWKTSVLYPDYAKAEYLAIVSAIRGKETNDTSA